MIQETTTKTTTSYTKDITAYRTKKLVHFFRAVALFSMPIRSSGLGLRRRK